MYREKEWKERNKEKSGNLRDYSNVSQLVCLANLESLNSVMIQEGLEQSMRLMKLNKVAISQMTILTKNSEIKLLDNSK